jgi:hypothetical protein
MTQTNMMRSYLTTLMTMGEKGDGPSINWDMADFLTPDPKSKLQKLLDENRNVFAFTMDNMTTI